MTYGYSALAVPGVGGQTSCRGGDRLDDVVDDRFDERSVVAFGHDADDGLGSGGPDHDPAPYPEAKLAPLDRRRHLRVVECGGAAGANVLEDLRQGIEAVAGLAHRPIGA